MGERTKKPLGENVPQGKRKIANHLLDTILTPALIRPHNQHRIRHYFGIRNWILQTGDQLPAVIDAARICQHPFSIPTDQGLLFILVFWREAHQILSQANMPLVPDASAFWAIGFISKWKIPKIALMVSKSSVVNRNCITQGIVSYARFSQTNYKHHPS